MFDGLFSGGQSSTTSAPNRSISFGGGNTGSSPFGGLFDEDIKAQQAGQSAKQQEHQQLIAQLQQQNQANSAAVKRNTVNNNPFNTIKIAGGKAVAHSAATAGREMAQGTARGVEELVPSALQLAGVKPPTDGAQLNKAGQFLLGKAPLQTIQQEAAGAQSSHPGGFHVKGTPITLTPKETGIAEGVGKTAVDVGQVLLGAKGGAAKVDKFNATTSAAKTTANNVAINNILKGAAKDTKAPAPTAKASITTPTTSSTSVEIAPKTVGQDSGQKPISAKPGEEGFVAPGEALKSAQDLIQKHQTSVKFSGDVQRFASSAEGSKGNLLSDAAKLTKNRTVLSNDEKTQLQTLRDSRTAGQDAPEVSSNVLQADKEATAFAKAKIANDAERAKLEGNLQKAKTITAQDPGSYTHRVAQDRGNAFDYVIQGDRKNPLSVNLGKGTPADKARTMFSATDEAGNRRVISVKSQSGKNAIGQKVTKANQVVAWENGKATGTLGNLPRKADIIGKEFKGRDGHTYKIDNATASEIEQHTGVKYYKDPYLTNQAAYLDSRIALENARMFESIKKAPESSSIMSGPDETAPKGWKSVPGLMQFQGYKFEPRAAQALHDAFIRGTSEGDALDKVGKVMRQTIVYFPVKHDFNMAAAYAVDRGASSLVNPMAYKRMVSSWKTAATALRTKNDLYQQIAKQGFGLTTNDKAEFEKVFKAELQKLTPGKINPIAKAAKLNPVNLYKSVQKLTVWEVQDFLNIARIAERMQPTLLSKGKNLNDALKETEKYSFQYKVPERVAGSRNASKLLQSNKVFFGRYRYDQYKITKNILKGMVDVRKPGEVLKNADKAAALAAGALLLWPLVNKGIQKVSGNSNAYNKAPGPMELAETAKKVATGKEDAGTAVANQVYLSSGLTLPIQVAQNRDSFTGKQIRDPNTPGKQQAKDTLSFLKGQVAPVQRSSQLQNTSGNKAVDIGLMLSGTNFPKNSPETNKLNSLKFDTLPDLQFKAKQLIQAGNAKGAKDLEDQYNQQIMDAAKKALQSSGKPVPSDQRLEFDLKKGGYLFSLSPKTIRNDQKPQQNTLDKLLRIKR